MSSSFSSRNTDSISRDVHHGMQIWYLLIGRIRALTQLQEMGYRKRSTMTRMFSTFPYTFIRTASFTLVALQEIGTTVARVQDLEGNCLDSLSRRSDFEDKVY
jgi:hypothetical protein